MGKHDWFRRGSELPAVHRMVLPQRMISLTSSTRVQNSEAFQGKAVIPCAVYGLRALGMAKVSGGATGYSVDIVATKLTTTATTAAITYTAHAIVTGQFVLAHYKSGKSGTMTLKTSGGTAWTQGDTYQMTWDGGGYLFALSTSETRVASTHRGVVPALSMSTKNRLVLEWYTVVDQMADDL